MQILFIGWNLRRLLTFDLLAFSSYCVNSLGVVGKMWLTHCYQSRATLQQHIKFLWHFIFRNISSSRNFRMKTFKTGRTETLIPPFNIMYAIWIKAEKQEREFVLYLHRQSNITAKVWCANISATRPLLLKLLFFPCHATISRKSRATFLTNQEKSYLLSRSRVRYKQLLRFLIGSID